MWTFTDVGKRRWLSVCSSFVLLFFGAICATAQLSISEARDLPLGTEVSVRGVVLNGSEMGSIRFVQDATAGIAAYPGTGSVSGFGSVERADSILITGFLTEYNGLLELNPITDFVVLGTSVSLPQPQLLSEGHLGESLESQLVLLPCGQFSETGTFSSGEYEFQMSSGTEVAVYLPGSSALAGEQIPDEAVNLTGIVSEYNGQYQLLPRDGNDLQETGNCLFFVEQPQLTDIQAHALELRWTTSAPAQGSVFYGTQPDNLDQFVAETEAVTEHLFLLEDLEPATFYYLQVQAVNNGVEISSPVQLYMTASLSSGQIDVYFNQWTDPAFSDGSYPAGNSYEEVEAAIIERIDAAQTSISVCMYNTSRDNFVDALIDAHQRGVLVRYIADSETTNSALQPPPPFSVLYGSPEEGIMHNKTLVIDPDDPQGAYVITGSMNMTFSNVINDYNNTLIVQDQSLARAYLAEFNEMWGGEESSPNLAQSRFGAEKTDNTPHFFRIGEVPVEVYFSPSDGTSSAILKALQSADEQVDFALLLFTKNDLADALIALQQQGKIVRGLIENADEWGTEFYVLQNAGIPVYEHLEDGLLHHKYAIVDEGMQSADPLVVTGSHNWTNAADQINDENTLVLHSQQIANLFRQEYEARWSDVVGVYEPLQPKLSWTLYPNPTANYLEVAYRFLGSREDVHWSVRDLWGRVLKQGHLGEEAEAVLRISLGDLPKGSYLLHLGDGSSRLFVKN